MIVADFRISKNIDNLTYVFKNPQRRAAEGWFRMGQALLLVSYEANIEFIPNVVVSNKTDILNKRVRE